MVPCGGVATWDKRAGAHPLIELLKHEDEVSKEIREGRERKGEERRGKRREQKDVWISS